MRDATCRFRSAWRRIAVLVLLAPLCCLYAAQPQSRPPVQAPKLVLAVVMDQFRYDYLVRFRADYRGGLDRALRGGAVLTDVQHLHYPAETAAGHAVLLTGAPPSVSGVIDHGWFDRESGKQVTSVGDPATQLLGGGGGPGASPRRLAVTTVGDEMKLAWRDGCRVIGVSFKDRSAVLPAGRLADAAYWFDGRSGSFVSSTYYFSGLPEWVKAFNAAQPAAAYAHRRWVPLAPNAAYAAFDRELPEAGPALYAALDATPFSNELIEKFAEAAVTNERLGQHRRPDLLTLSFSGNDFIGHAFGPDSPEARDAAIRMDVLLGRLFDFLDARLGMQNVLVTLTSDHGVAPIPDDPANARLPGGRLSAETVGGALQKELTAQFGAGQWITAFTGPFVYLNRALIRERKLEEREVERAAARAIGRTPHILRVYTRDQLEDGRVPDDPIGRSVLAGFHQARAGDLVIVPDPFWISASRGAGHGAPFNYDAHVPLIFLGPNVKPGRYDDAVDALSVAPTIALLAGAQRPSGAFARVLREVVRSR